MTIVVNLDVKQHHKFFKGEYFPSSTVSRRASCKLLVKECALNTGKLPPGRLPRNNVGK